MPSARLDDRGVVAVSGAEARTFLDRLVTCDVEQVSAGEAEYGALLSPQGKILADFIIHVGPRDGEAETFWLDVPLAVLPDLVKRLTLYRLRAKIALADRSAEWVPVAGWAEAPVPESALAWAPDPRLAALGWRAIVPREAAPPGDRAAYDEHRIALGIPEGGYDFAFADAFPHEALMDQLAGVDFKKGCYVGQEVVSRMQHRGTARTRILPAIYESAAPEPGQEIRAGDRVIGKTGSASGARGLVMVRLDRIADAQGAGQPIAVDGVGFAIEAPDWLRFEVPGAAKAGAA